MGLFGLFKRRVEPSNWREAANASGYQIKGIRPAESAVENARRLGVTHVMVRTSQDQRVCHVCQSHDRVIYPIDSAPHIPMCEKCRCYHEPVIDTDFIQWPSSVYHNGKITVMSKKQFDRITS